MNELAPQTPRPRRWRVILVIALGAFILYFGVLTYQAYKALPQGEGNTAALQGAGLTTDPTIVAGSNASQASLHTEDDPVWGTADAPVQVIAFEDFQCPYCREAFPIVRQVLTRYEDRIHFIYRDFPLTGIHPLAQTAAEAGQCAFAQGKNQFWALHDRMYQNQDALSEETIVTWAKLSGADEEVFRTCLNSRTYEQEVREDFSDGVAAGVRGTPTFFINGRKIEGVIPLEAWETLFEKI